MSVLFLAYSTQHQVLHHPPHGTTFCWCVDGPHFVRHLPVDTWVAAVNMDGQVPESCFQVSRAETEQRIAGPHEDPV